MKWKFFNLKQKKMSKVVYKNAKIGDKFRIASDKYVANGFSKDDIVSCYMKQSNYIYVRNSMGQQIAALVSDLLPAVMTKEDLNKNIKDLENEIASYKDKLDWMEETGNDEYDETEVKVWKTLKTLNSKSTDAEKAKVIAKLING